MKNLGKIVKDIGEKKLIERVKDFCAKDTVGDDGAVVNLSAGQSLVVTTDILVDGVHFSDRTTTAFDVGWRAATANLSDLAAMGATPVGITVGLSLPGEVAIDWVDNLYRGLNACLEQYDTSILGGDICYSPTITIAINAFGQVLPNRVISRDNACPGDAIVVTGNHGNSRAGLELLLHQKNRMEEGGDRDYLIAAHQRPLPRLDVLEYLWQISVELRVAGMDSSDGLADTLVQICHASKVGARVDLRTIPILPALSRSFSPQQALKYALYGGEDFELVLCLHPKPAYALVELLGKDAAIIGRINEGEDVELIDSKGVYQKQILTLDGGFQHF